MVFGSGLQDARAEPQVAGLGFEGEGTGFKVQEEASFESRFRMLGLGFRIEGREQTPLLVLGLALGLAV